MKVLQCQYIFTSVKIILVLKKLRHKKCIHENDAAINLISLLKHFFLWLQPILRISRRTVPAAVPEQEEISPRWPGRW